MATKKISEFTTLGSLSDSDILPVVNAGSNKKITGATLKTYAQSGLTIPTDVSDLTDTTSLLGSGGAQGPAGNDGADGADGAPGQGVPTGGTVGQVLAKIDSTDYNTEWVTPTGSTDLGSFTIDNNVLDVAGGVDIYIETSEAGGGGESRLVLKPNDDNGGINPTRLEGSYGVGIWSNTTESTKEWLFDNNGDLKLPAGGDIVDSTGASVLGSGGATALSGLSDVAIEGPIEGSVLTWNNSQNHWENRDIPTPSVISNNTYSVSVGTDGVVTMTTSRGGLEFGALPEPGGPTHFHIMRPAGESGSGGTDLYFGDDYNYVLQRPASYNDFPAYGVEIGANDNNGGTQQVWRFGTDGDLVLPAGGDIKDSTGASVLGGGSANTGNITFSSDYMTGTDGQIRMRTLDVNQTASYSFNPSNSDYSTAVWDGTGITFNDPTQAIYDAIWALTDVSVIEVQVGSTWFTVTWAGSSTPGMPQAPTLFVNESAVGGPLNIDVVDITINEGTESYAEIDGTDFKVDVQDDIRMYANDTFLLSNRSSSDPIRIETDDGSHQWSFNSDGDLILPNGGDIKNDNGNSLLFSGSYNDLSDTPSFSSLVNDTQTVSLGTDGVLTLPEGGTIDNTPVIVTVTLDQFNDGGFTGTQVFTRVSDTLYELSPGGPYMTLISGIWRLKISTATYYDSTDLINWGNVAGASPAPVGTLTTVESISLEVDGNDWIFDANGGLTLPIGVSIDNSVSALYPKIIADSGKLFSVQGQGNTGSAALAWTVDPNAASQYAAVAVNRAGGDNLAKVILQAQSDSGDVATVKLWKFDETGTTTLPAGGTITEGGGFTGAIKLTPAGGANEYQALLIYPTAAADGDHIHLTAGGGTTELYLGNDFHYVKLVDGGDVEVQASTGDLSSRAVWTFDTDGNIDTRQALGIKVPNGVPSSITDIGMTTGYWELNPLSNLATTGGSGSGLRVNVTQTDGYVTAIAIATAGTGYTAGDYITVTSGTSSAAFIIAVAGRNTWQFGDDGTLTVPANSSILTNETELKIATHSTTTYTFNQAYWAALNGNATRMFTFTGDAQYFSCTVTANQDGTYTVADPTGNSFEPGNWFKVPGNELGGVTPANDIQINIATVDGDGVILTTTITGTAVGKQWQFGDDGLLTFPDNLVIAGNTNVFGLDSALIAPAPDLPLIALSSGANGAVSSIWVEDIGNVGTSNIAAVYANPTSGSKIVRIVVGQNGVGSGPNLWDFGTDGNLTLPAGGDILDSTGASVLGGGTTLPANASGYLVNDGTGALSWAAGDGTFSGDYDDLTNKPTLFDGDYNSLTNKPTYKETVSTGTGPGGNNQADSLVLAGLNPTENIPSTYGGDLILKGGYGGANNDLFGEVRIKSGTIGSNFEWHFTVDKKIKLPSGGDIGDSTGASVFVSLSTLKQVVAASTDFADFQSRIANM